MPPLPGCTSVEVRVGHPCIVTSCKCKVLCRCRLVLHMPVQSDPPVLQALLIAHGDARAALLWAPPNAGAPGSGLPASATTCTDARRSPEPLTIQVLFAGTLGHDVKTKKSLYQGDQQVEVRLQFHVHRKANLITTCMHW
jgi:hypothetical protein